MHFEINGISIITSSLDTLGEAISVGIDGKPLYELLEYFSVYTTINSSAYCLKSYSSFSPCNNSYQFFEDIIIPIVNALGRTGIVYIRGTDYGSGEHGASYFDGSYIYINNGENSKKTVYVFHNNEWKDRKALPAETHLIGLIPEDSFEESLTNQYIKLVTLHDDLLNGNQSLFNAMAYQEECLKKKREALDQESIKYSQKAIQTFMEENESLFKKTIIPDSLSIAGKSFCLREFLNGTHIASLIEELRIRGGYGSYGRDVFIHSYERTDILFEDYYVLGISEGKEIKPYDLCTDYVNDYAIINEFQLWKLIQKTKPVDENESYFLSNFAAEKVHKLEKTYPQDDLVKNYYFKKRKAYLQKILDWRSSVSDIKQYVMNSKDYSLWNTFIDYPDNLEIKDKTFFVSGGEKGIEKNMLQRAIEIEGGIYSPRLSKAVDCIIEVGYRSANGIQEKKEKSNWKFVFITDIQFWSLYTREISEELAHIE